MNIMRRIAIFLFKILTIGSAVRAGEPITFMENGGWCWYQDPRVIIHEGKLIMGGVEGNGDGSAVIGVYDLASKEILGRTIVRENFDKDDHNSPAFFVRPDNSILTVYARHNRDRNHFYRISKSPDYLKWGKEKVFKHDYETASKVTYMNLYEMREEGKLYNFFRGIRFNPCFITSQDDGETWGEPTHLIASEVKGRHRPYARYSGNGRDTVHISFTDAHPRLFGNSIYYAAFRDGAFFNADGSRLSSLSDGPIRPSQAEKIFEGGGGKGRGGKNSAHNSAWTAAMASDEDNRPHIGYTLYVSNKDHRYRIASWDGKKWFDREVAYGGKCLYDIESSYTGLIALDPVDPTIVVISTDVDPTTGKDLGGTHEIYRAKVGPKDDIKNIKWIPVTSNSAVRNIRPIIVRDDNQRAICWLRGEYNSYTSYKLDVVGLVEDVTAE